MVGKMYRSKLSVDLWNDDDFILVAELATIVCLQNARTNDLHWVTKHILKLKYKLKGTK